MLLQLITDGFLLYQEPLLALDLNVSSDFLSKKQCKLTTMDSQHMNIIDLKGWGDYSINQYYNFFLCIQEHSYS